MLVYTVPYTLFRMIRKSIIRGKMTMRVRLRPLSPPPPAFPSPAPTPPTPPAQAAPPPSTLDQINIPWRLPAEDWETREEENS
jgi:hypothetical protein